MAKKTEIVEHLTERTMLRMRPSQRARWAAAAHAMSVEFGMPIDESTFLRSAADDLAKRWGAK